MTKTRMIDPTFPGYRTAGRNLRRYFTLAGIGVTIYLVYLGFILACGFLLIGK